MSRDYAGPDDPLWFKDAVIYQVHVRAFHDSNADGIGDFRGLAQKLDYLRDLGINTLWLLPFYPSPLKDDGYDIADYTKIHPMYGTMADFTHLLREAHRRGLRVVTELVLNHTSDQHAWFQRARRSPKGSRFRDFYVWSDSQEKYRDARIIFKDFEASNWTWDPVARAYFWHRFYAHQPDLNFDNPHVHRALLRVVDLWLEAGVDGLRLDAVPYLYEREGTSCENLPETHGYLKELRRHVDAKFRNRMLLAEANQWPEDAVAYFGGGDECHMAFHFPIMPRMFMAVHMEDRYPLIDILGQTPAIPEASQWALFLRNHDELTLEMVTDEERDYMYRVYARDRQARINLGIRRRLAPLLENNRRKFELLNGLLFSLPGTPIIYYGDEIGMGDNIYLGDRNGVRTPMQWSSDRNAGFSRTNPQKLYLPVNIDPEYHFEAVNVEAQQNNPHSPLWWMRRLIALSRRYKAFGRGTMEILTPENRKVFSFVRRHGDEAILVVANLSRFVQYVELDLSSFKGCVPVELFGKTDFPSIGELPYLLTLGPHGFYWFLLEPARVIDAPSPPGEARRTIEVAGDWMSLFKDKAKAALEEALAGHLPGRRWFAGKARKLKAVRILDAVRLELGGSEAAMVLVQADFTEGTPQVYALPLGFAAGDRIRPETTHAAIAGLRVRGEGGEVEGILHDAAIDPAFGAGLLDAVARRRHFRGTQGQLLAAPTAAFRRLRGPGAELPPPAPVRGEQSNTSLLYGDRLVLKLLRRIEPGLNPDLEIGRFLTDRTSFANTPPVGGFLEYRREGGETFTWGILTGFVPNQGDAWRYTLDELRRYFESVRSRSPYVAGTYLETARILGRRTAEMHQALASDTEDPDFAPEPFTPFYQRSVYQSMRNQMTQTLPLLKKRLKELPEAARPEAERLLAREKDLHAAFEAVYKKKITTTRIRCHGDYHLGQVLFTGKDFIILDFEGEPARPLSERRIKRSPLRDVAGMIRSFHYAAWAALFAEEERGEGGADTLTRLEAAAHAWYRSVTDAFVREYKSVAGGASFFPASEEGAKLLLNAFLLDKGVYELAYELNHRPAWIRIPLQGLRHLLEPENPSR